MHYQELLNELRHPYDMLLRDSFLLPSATDTLLVVPKHAVKIISSLEILAMVYPIAKKLYPETRSLYVVFGPEYDYVKEGKLDLIDMKVTVNA